MDDPKIEINGDFITMEYYDGYKEYYKNSLLHRGDGPAIEYASGSKEYWINNKLHREDGPAIEYISGDKGYWKNGVQYASLEELLMDNALE